MTDGEAAELAQESKGFVHLHVHSQYSIADASTRIDDLCRSASEMGMPALALTDHDNLYGAVHFASACKGAKVKPIYGCALGIAQRPMGEQVVRTHQVNLLVLNPAGYANLLELVSMAHLRAPATSAPRVSPDFLGAHADGLLCLTGNLSGEVPNALLRGQRREAERHLRRYVEQFGRDRVLVEVQLTDLPDHQRLAPQLVELAALVGVEAVASNDVHYLRREHARAHEVLVAIGLGIQARPDPSWLPTTDYHFASPAEMRSRFRVLGLEHLCDRTLEVADRAAFDLPLGKYFLPQYRVPDGYDIPTYFAHLSRQGLQQRIEEARRVGRALDDEGYRQRLETEIAVIDQMGFAGYFLIVWDFIRWAKEQGISVGPGRGSGAGSLVAWSLRITDIDPIPYNLLFERFLNPERVSMPDFDIDFCVKRRGEVIDYVAGHYGKDHVAQIVTFGTLKAKGAIRDCGRVLGVDLGKVNDLAKLIPDDPKLEGLAEARTREPRIDELAANDPELRALLETAEQLEGSVRQTGMHAAGVVISEDVLWRYVPVARGVNGENVTMFAKDEVEKAGLIKFDFLGLKNLTMLTHCVELVNRRRGTAEPLDLAAIPLDDQEAFAVISRGQTAGIFQCESNGFTQMMKDLQPTAFEDLIAAGALYRPGPLGMGMHTRYIERKHLREPVVVPHPCLEPILRETYGVIVYQEQVMQIAREMAGYTLGGADILRRAMGKKKKEEMDKQRSIFLDGAAARGIEAAIAIEVFDLMESFANYGFNKSHSAAYGLITYQTAWVKAHYPTEFFAALLTSDAADTDAVVQYIQEARGAGQKVLPPDVNHSQLSFSVAEGAIRFGLAAVKNVGEAAIDAILEARRAGPFKSLFDLCRRVSGRMLNRRVLEQLVKCGALDGFLQSREMLWATLGKALDRAAEEVRDREAGQGSLFGGLTSVTQVEVQETYSQPTEIWTLRQLLEYEKECLGFYVTGHPLDRVKGKLSKLSVRPLSQAKDPEIRREVNSRGRTVVKVAGTVSGFRERLTAKGSRMGFLLLEDLSGQAELTVFDRALDGLRPLLARNEPLLITISISPDRQDEQINRLVVDEAWILEDEVQKLTDHLRIELMPEHCRGAALQQLADLLRRAAALGPAVDAALAAQEAAALSPAGELSPSATDADAGQLDAFTAAPTPMPRPTVPAVAPASAGAGRATGPVPTAPTPPTTAQVRLLVRVPGEGRVLIDPRTPIEVVPSSALIGRIERLVGRGAVSLG